MREDLSPRPPCEREPNRAIESVAMGVTVIFELLRQRRFERIDPGAVDALDREPLPVAHDPFPVLIGRREVELRIDDLAGR